MQRYADPITLDHLITLTKRIAELEKQVKNVNDANVQLWCENKRLRTEILTLQEEQNDWASLHDAKYSE